MSGSAGGAAPLDVTAGRGDRAAPGWSRCELGDRGETASSAGPASPLRIPALPAHLQLVRAQSTGQAQSYPLQYRQLDTFYSENNSLQMLSSRKFCIIFYLEYWEVCG